MTRFERIYDALSIVWQVVLKSPWVWLAASLAWMICVVQLR